MSHPVHLITRQSYRQAAQVLGRAFVDDPVSVAAYQNFPPEKREHALVVDFTTEVLLCVRKGYPLQVSDNGNVIAAAVIYPPGAYPLGKLDQWMILAKSFLGNGWYDMRDWLHWLKEVDKAHPTAAHYYLEYLGVEPSHQGKGFGSSILHHLTTRADVVGVGCYLENANPRNVPFYERYGFKVIGEKDIIRTRTWFMWRSPRVNSPEVTARGNGMF